jgi:hypothetical protein
VIAASSGKMPTTSVRRLISPLRRSKGWVEWSLAVLLGQADLGKHVLLGVVQQGRGLGQLWGSAGRRPGATRRQSALPILRSARLI